MRRLPLAVSVLALVTPAAVTAAQVAPSSAAPVAQHRGSLSVSPTPYLGGEGLVWRGNLGVGGRRTIHLEFNMNRPGDQWTAVKGHRSHTAADGSFRFVYPAPSMFDISYRVVGGGHATPAKVFNAKSQDLVAWVAGQSQDGPQQVTPGRTFAMRVDATPTLSDQPDTRGVPALPGRALTLETRRADGTWSVVGHTTEDSSGNGTFTGLSAAQGITVYRVVEEAWTRNGSKIGWFPSFPVYVYAGVTPPAQHTGRRLSTPGGTVRATKTGQQTHGWHSINYDYDWMSGEALTSPASRGATPHGYWQDFSTGAGRVATHNGALTLVSSRNGSAGPGDFGTTSAILANDSFTQGRWEVRFRTRTSEAGQGAYHYRVELVPAGSSDQQVTPSITIADVVGGTHKLTYGLAAGSSRWSHAIHFPGSENASPALGAEVTKSHIAWFVNGKVTGYLKMPAALAHQSWTLRLSLVGQGSREMNHSSLFSDWQREYPVTGKQVRSGPKVPRIS